MIIEKNKEVLKIRQELVEEALNLLLKIIDTKEDIYLEESEQNLLSSLNNIIDECIRHFYRDYYYGICDNNFKEIIFEKGTDFCKKKISPLSPDEKEKLKKCWPTYKKKENSYNLNRSDILRCCDDFSIYESKKEGKNENELSKCRIYNIYNEKNGFHGALRLTEEKMIELNNQLAVRKSSETTTILRRFVFMEENKVSENIIIK